MLPSLQIDLALAALEAGETELAKKHATETLKKNTDAESWDYGNTNKGRCPAGRVSSPQRDGWCCQFFLSFFKGG